MWSLRMRRGKCKRRCCSSGESKRPRSDTGLGCRVGSLALWLLLVVGLFARSWCRKRRLGIHSNKFRIECLERSSLFRIDIFFC